MQVNLHCVMLYLHEIKLTGHLAAHESVAQTSLDITYPDKHVTDIGQLKLFYICNLRMNKTIPEVRQGHNFL